MAETKAKAKTTKLSVYSVPNVTATRMMEKHLNDGIISYGDDNQYPDYLWNLYCDAPTQQAAIDFKQSCILGRSLGSHSKDVVNLKGQTITDIAKKAVFDYVLFGGMAFQVIYNSLGEIAEVYWCSWSKLRTNYDCTKVWWCDDWRNGAGEPKIEYDLFNPEKENKTTQILYIRNSATRSVYPVPSYQSAIDAILTECEVQHWHLNNIKNNFAGSFVLNMLGAIPDEDERKEQEKKIQNKFCGSDSAGNILINWAETADEKIEVMPIEDSQADKKFSRLAKDVMESIAVAHRLTSLCLIGKHPENGQGFSAIEFKSAFDIFNTTVIAPIQDEVTDALQKVFPDKGIAIEPFVIPKE